MNNNDISYASLIYEQKYDCSNILLIDGTLEDYQDLVNAVNSNTMAIVYSYDSTKEDLSNVLCNFTNISRIGFAFSSNPYNCPVIFLDNEPFFTYDPDNNNNLLFIINTINNYNVKNIDFLACNTLNYENWNYYYSVLLSNTSVIIGASDNKTGNIKYGGDWVLENSAEDIEKIYFTENIQYYEYVLDNLTWATGLDSPAGITSYNYNLYVGTYFGNSITRIPINSNGTAGTSSTWYTGSQNLYAVGYHNGFIYTSYIPNGTGPIIQIAVNANGSAGTVNTTWITNITTPFTIVGYNSYLFTSGNSDGIKQIPINANNTAGAITTWYNIATISIAINNSILYATLSSTGIIIIPINANGSAGTPTTKVTTQSLYGIAIYNSYLYSNTYTGSAGYVYQFPINANGSLGTINSTWRASSNSYMLNAAQNPSGNYSLYETHVNGTTISSFDLSGTELPPLANSIGNSPAGIKYGTIDICNNFSSIVINPNPTINGVSFSSGFYTYLNGIKYDLAQLYYINQTLNLTPSINTTLYTIYNSSKYDLSTFFNVSNVSPPPPPPPPPTYTPPNFLNTTKIMYAVSVRRVIIPYTGPIMNIRNSGTGATQDFYSDSSQNYLTTGANNTGTSYASWIGGNTGYVRILYDQCGKNNHAVNSTNNTTQPFLQLQSGKYVLRMNTGLLTFLYTTTPSRPNTVFSHFMNQNTNFGTLMSGYTGSISTTVTTYDYGLRFGSGGNNIGVTTGNTNDWFFSSSGTKLAYNNGGAATLLAGVGNWNLLALSVGNSTWSIIVRGVTYPLYFGTIGVNGQQATRGITGYFTEMICHNQTMVAQDMIDFYNNRLF